MKHASLNFIMTGLLIAGTSAFGFEGYPQADKMEPRIAKVGSVITITGTALAKEKVEEVFLTDHRFDMKVKVLEQSEKLLKIRIPPFAKPGRLQLLLLTAGEKPAYLEQPLYVQVEEGEVTPAAPVEVTKKAPKTVEVASIGNNIPVPPAEPARSAPAPAPQPVLRAPVEAPPPPAAQVKREEPPAAQSTAAPVPVAPQQPAAGPQPQPIAGPDTAAAATRTVVPPRLIKRTPVSMPPTSSSVGGDATVELQLRIRTDGRVGNVKVVKGNPIFVQAATRSVRDWVYESAYVGSTPVETDITVILNFKR